MRLNRNEKKLLDAMKDKPTIRQAAMACGLSESQAYNMLFRLRKKKKECRDFINVLLNYCKGSLLTNKALAYKIIVRDERLLE